ncbi:MAG: site-specific integrase [Chitinophagaceae bacterium]|nr:MAG: site-specific integrase [Chitinophagaceae bacterium]
MGRAKKSPKGTVTVFNDEGRIRLRWRFLGKRYSLNLFFYNKTNLLQAKKVALQIEQEMVTQTFDPTLERYKPSLQEEQVPKASLVGLFMTWVKEVRNRDVQRDVDYCLIMRMLERWGAFIGSEGLERLNRETISPKTYNARLRLLRAFYGWAVKKGDLNANPFEDVKPRQIKKGMKAKRKPFSEDEIAAVLKAFKNDTFCPSSSRFKHSFYYPFVYFLFKTGVRNAEAIGLRVKHVDPSKRLIYIVETLARTKEGTNAAARIRKETKNGKERMLPLDDDLLEVLAPNLKDKRADDLVFLSPKGMAIDDKMFQRRVFKKVLQGLKLEERVLYACRHTFGSRCIHEGLTPVMTAFLMGNNPETALRNYTHLVGIPKGLPKI